MKTGMTLQALASEIEFQHKTKRDFVAASTRTHICIAHNEKLDRDVMKLHLRHNNDDMIFDVNDLFQEQMANHLHVPISYYRRMTVEAPQLAADNLNTWLRRSPDDRMIRTLGAREKATPTYRPHGLARAFLSNKYRTMDNFELANVILPIIQEAGVTIESCDLTEKRLYIQAVNRRVTGEVKVGGTVAAGVIISNSEVGAGSLEISALIYTLACTNGMVVRDGQMKQRHVGRRQGGESEDIFELLSNEAKQADDRALYLKVRDLTKLALEEARFREQLEKLQISATNMIKSKKLERVVEVTGRRFAFNENEQGSVLTHLINGGDLSQWGLSSAITRTAQDLTSYDRAVEFEKIGGEVIELTGVDWAAIASAN